MRITASFESSVVLNSFQTPTGRADRVFLFESSVVLNSFQTDVSEIPSERMFESSVVLNSFQTLFNAVFVN